GVSSRALQARIAPQLVGSPHGRKPAERGARGVSPSRPIPCFQRILQGIHPIPADSGKTVPKSPTIQGGSRKIPYASEQGDFFAEQGIEVPCWAENRDISRLMRRLFDANPAEAKAIMEGAPGAGPDPVAAAF